ncbi:MAG: ATPase, T2SS/T4P/T4SS family [Pirellulaceae bacterium]
MSEGEELNPVPIDQLPPIKFAAAGDTADLREANLQAVQPSPGYSYLVVMVADAITKRADLVLMDFTSNAVGVRYQVDGLWHNMPTMPRTSGDYMLASLKQLAGLDYRERRARQIGKFQAEYLKKKHKCRVTSQGVSSGERVALVVDREKPPLENVEDIGMRPGMQSQLVKLMNEPAGLIMFSGLPGDGLSTTWRAALQSTDRFMRDFFVVEEQSRQEPEIINVTRETYDSSTGDTVHSVMRSLMLREPNVVAFTEMADGSSLDELSKLSNKHELTTFCRLPARHAVEAVMRGLMLKPNVPEFARALRAVTGQRLLRLLCQTCRQAYQPNPNLIAQLGLPPARVPVLYRHFQPAPEQVMDAQGRPIEIEPCENCGGPGYFERTGIFELLLVDDRFRAAMQDPEPNVQKLAAAAQQSGHITLREEGIVLVARGDTSLEELQRVLKK